MSTLTSRLAAALVAVLTLAGCAGPTHKELKAVDRQDMFHLAVEDQYPELTGEQATGWVLKMCAIFDDGWTLKDMPPIDRYHHDMFLFMLAAGVSVYCPEYTEMVSQVA